MFDTIAMVVSLIAALWLQRALGARINHIFEEGAAKLRGDSIFIAAHMAGLMLTSAAYVAFYITLTGRAEAL